MVVTTVMVEVKPEKIEAFTRECVRNHEQSVKETGNMRFDILQSANDPSRFLLYEAYESAEAAAAHKKTAHYAAWRDAVADMMAAPREGIAYKAVRP